MIGDYPDLLNLYLESSPAINSTFHRSLLEALALFPFEHTTFKNHLTMLHSLPLDLIDLDLTSDGLPDC
jgi:hypothetical protein